MEVANSFPSPVMSLLSVYICSRSQASYRVFCDHDRPKKFATKLLLRFAVFIGGAGRSAPKGVAVLATGSPVSPVSPAPTGGVNPCAGVITAGEFRKVPND